MMPAIADYLLFQNLLMVVVAIAVPVVFALFASGIHRHGKSELPEGLRETVRDMNRRTYSQIAAGREKYR